MVSTKIFFAFPGGFFLGVVTPQNLTELDEASDQVTIELHRSTRTCTATERYDNPVLEVMLLDNDEPTNYGEAMVGPDSNKWLGAMKSEKGSMYENQVWTLVDLPVEWRVIEYKWTFEMMTNADGKCHHL